MQMLYNSDSFVVVRFDVPVDAAGGDDAAPRRGGYEIVDKHARREIYLQGALAESFREGVQALADSGDASEEAFDEFIGRYCVLAPHPVTLH
jgi:hypothetical protein